jgi:hypothetical protein
MLAHNEPLSVDKVVQILREEGVKIVYKPVAIIEIMHQKGDNPPTISCLEERDIYEVYDKIFRKM